MAKVFLDKVEKTRESSLQLKVDELRAADPDKHRSLRVNDLKRKKILYFKEKPFKCRKNSSTNHSYWIN